MIRKAYRSLAVTQLCMPEYGNSNLFLPLEPIVLFEIRLNRLFFSSYLFSLDSRYC